MEAIRQSSALVSGPSPDWLSAKAGDCKQIISTGTKAHNASFIRLLLTPHSSLCPIEFGKKGATLTLFEPNVRLHSGISPNGCVPRPNQDNFQRKRRSAGNFPRCTKIVPRPNAFFPRRNYS